MQEESNKKDLDLEQEWAEARAAAGLPADRSERADKGTVDEPVDVSPFTLLYSGFFLGPAATLLLSLYFLGSRTSTRDVVLLTGICGAAWSVAQAGAFLLAGEIPTAYVQMIRSGANFAAGAAALWVLWRRPGVSFLHDRQSLIQTAVLGFLLVAAFLAIPDEVRIWLGR
ncbi:MAG: hypothetical protein ACQEVA_01790 [Myxococcota bacterium]